MPAWCGRRQFPVNAPLRVDSPGAGWFLQDMADLRSVSELTILGLPAGGITAAFEKWLTTHPVAGFLLFRRDYETPDQLPTLARRLRSLNGDRRTFITLDEEGGWVTQMSPHPARLPSARVLARGTEAEETEALAHRLGAELAAREVDVDFAPVYDVETEPSNPVIGPRSFGHEPRQVARYAEAVRRGLQAGGVLACAKHFPGHGATTVDSHLGLPRLEAAGSVLEAVHLLPFEIAIRGDVPLVMAAHVVYPELDPSGKPASLSHRILSDLLRQRLGFRGAVVTDALEMRAVADLAPPDEVAVEALLAGSDLLLYGAFTPSVERAIQGADEALDDGRIPRVRVADAAAHREALWVRRDAVRAAARPAPEVLPDPVSVCRRGLSWLGSDGEPPSVSARAVPWGIIEPAWAHGPGLAALLGERGWQVESHPWERLTERMARPGEELLIACPRRDLLTRAEHEWITHATAVTAVWLVAFAQDGFLADFPGAAGRLSAGDPSPEMRRAVVEALTSPSRLAARAAR